MIKYNEIMSNATVDPEMKSRIMDAVSKAIKEQPGGAVVTDLKRDIEKEEQAKPVRKKKAQRIPVSVIASIAAGVIVLLGLGAFGLTSYFSRAKNASAPVHVHSSEIEVEIDSAINAGADPQAGNDGALNQEIDAVLSGSGNDKKNYNITTNTNTKTDNVKAEQTTTAEADGDREGPTSQVLGDPRLDKISKAMPFELKGTGSSSSGENIAIEIFLGVNGEKALLYAAPEGTDLMKEIYTVKYEGTGGTTPAGTAVTFYRIPFNNVKPLAKGETSTDSNAVLFTKGGKTYLILFSEIYTTEQMGKVVDTI